MQDQTRNSTQELKEGSPTNQLIQSALDLVMALVRARRGALFGVTPEGTTLLASRALDQEALEIMKPLWPNAPRPLRAGSAYFGVSVGRAYMVLPCLAPDILGLLYVETAGSMPRVPAGHLSTFSGILGRAIRDAITPKDARPEAASALDLGSESAERANLVVLLERNEWNVSRVARLLGVTRMTIYNRLERLNVPRKRVRKTVMAES